MSEWQSIKNPPNSDRDVLMYDAISKKLLVGCYSDGAWFDTIRGDTFHATHWCDVDCRAGVNYTEIFDMRAAITLYEEKVKL